VKLYIRQHILPSHQEHTTKQPWKTSGYLGSHSSWAYRLILDNIMIVTHWHQNMKSYRVHGEQPWRTNDLEIILLCQYKHIILSRINRYAQDEWEPSYPWSAYIPVSESQSLLCSFGNKRQQKEIILNACQNGKMCFLH
jgi:hypothetical protein